MKKNHSCTCIKIRPCKSYDLPHMMELISQINSQEDLSTIAEEQFRLELNHAKTDQCRFVATLESEIVGTMGCSAGPLPSPYAIWADWLVVDKAYQRLGIASLLFAEIERFAITNKKYFICLDIGNIDHERAAFMFHRNNGFQIVGQIPDYWGPHEHLNIMVKHLSQQA